MVADLVGVGLAVSEKNKTEANFSLFHYPQAPRPRVILAHHSATCVFMVPSDDIPTPIIRRRKGYRKGKVQQSCPMSLQLRCHWPELTNMSIPSS